MMQRLKSPMIIRYNTKYKYFPVSIFKEDYFLFVFSLFTLVDNIQNIVAYIEVYALKKPANNKDSPLFTGKLTADMVNRLKLMVFKFI